MIEMNLADHRSNRYTPIYKALLSNTLLSVPRSFVWPNHLIVVLVKSTNEPKSVTPSFIVEKITPEASYNVRRQSTIIDFHQIYILSDAGSLTTALIYTSISDNTIILMSKYLVIQHCWRKENRISTITDHGKQQKWLIDVAYTTEKT